MRYEDANVCVDLHEKDPTLHQLLKFNGTEWGNIIVTLRRVHTGEWWYSAESGGYKSSDFRTNENGDGRDQALADLGERMRRADYESRVTGLVMDASRKAVGE